MKKLLAAVLCLILTASLVAGCSSAPAPGSGGFSFPPVTINITVEGNMDESTAEDLKSKFRDTMRELYEEFRNEEIEQMALKEQYAF